jgi:(S)-2-hydroxyglutarate dehydrogenase
LEQRRKIDASPPVHLEPVTSISADVAIVGGGIVGLATAYRLSERHPGLRITVYEKEDEIARHQSGRNSGVVHTGVYYAPGSAKAIYCRAGYDALSDFCRAEALPFERIGKVIVAVDDEEVGRLDAIEQRGLANGVRCSRVDASGLREVEPHAAGIEALHVPDGAITDYSRVAARLAERVRERGGQILTGVRVHEVRERDGGLVVETSGGHHEAGWFVNCAGLYADRLARACGVETSVRIAPFRGAYYTLQPQARRLCRGLIYPVPDPRFPFLGIHFTRRVGGRVDVGPSAVLAFAREGYLVATIEPRELLEMLLYPGFRRLARRHWRSGVRELLQAVSRRAYVRAARRLVPALEPGDLLPARSGVRAQAVDADGRLVDDFLLVDTERAVHVLNAPSPAATSSLAIGSAIADRLAAKWG